MNRRNMGSPPGDMDELKTLIATKRVVLSLRQEVVIRLLLERPDAGAFGTARSIGAACHVSASTVVRVAQYFGFSDFQGLKSLFQEHLRERSRLAMSLADKAAVCSHADTPDGHPALQSLSD